MALARLARRPNLFTSDFDPLLRWLVVDGYGFHEGYFRWNAIDAGRRVPAGFTGYTARAFDQGLGRSLWFVCAAGPQRVDAALRSLPTERWPDLWSGVGLACAYAGGVGRAEIESLARFADGFGPYLAQGAAFAARAREGAGNPAPHTELACRVLCACGAAEAADATVRALDGLTKGAVPERDASGDVPAYEVWRRRLQARFGAMAAA